MDYFMEERLLKEFATEKEIFKKLLIGSRMIEVSYGEMFSLLFEQSFYNGKHEEIQLALMLDAPCWFGRRDEWINRIKALGSYNVISEGEDCFLAYELTRLRYNNLIQVQSVDFLEDFLSITFQGNNILSIAYYSESDYAWILEEFGPKKEHEKMMICCQGNELFQNNIPIFLN